MATVETVMDGARTILRDFPRYFTASVSKTDSFRTLELPYQNVSAGGLAVWAVEGSTILEGHPAGASFTPSATTFSYALDSRNGLIKVVNPPTDNFAAGAFINVEGYYYEWVADQDLKFHALNIIAEHAHHRRDFILETVSDVEADAMSLGTVVDALWSLILEIARDIDVSTAEAIHLPVAQRYKQIEDLLFSPNGFLAKYKEKCRMLNVGIDRIEVITMRRISRTTNRLVPIYTSREWDDMDRPKREFPSPDTPSPSTPPPSFVPAKQVLGYDEYPDSPNP